MYNTFFKLIELLFQAVVYVILLPLELAALALAIASTLLALGTLASVLVVGFAIISAILTIF